MGVMGCIENKINPLKSTLTMQKSGIEHIYFTGFNTLAAIVLNSIYSI